MTSFKLTKRDGCLWCGVKKSKINKMRAALEWIEIESRDGSRTDFKEAINQKAKEALKE